MQNRSQCNLLDTCIYLHYSLFLLLPRIHFLKPLNELEEHQQNRKNTSTNQQDGNEIRFDDV